MEIRACEGFSSTGLDDDAIPEVTVQALSIVLLESAQTDPKLLELLLMRGRDFGTFDVAMHPVRSTDGTLVPPN